MTGLCADLIHVSTNPVKCQKLRDFPRLSGTFRWPWPVLRLARVRFNRTGTAARRKLWPTGSRKKENVMSLNLKELFGGNRITKGLRGVYFDTPLCLFRYSLFVERYMRQGWARWDQQQLIIKFDIRNSKNLK
jgi:hypothetical protein